MSRLFGDSNNISSNNNNNNKDRSNWFNKDFLRGRAFSRSNSSQPNSDSDSDDDNPTTSRREQLWSSLSSNVENLTDRVFKKDQDLDTNAFESQSLDIPSDNALIGQVKQVNGKNLTILEQIAEGSTAFLYLVAQNDGSNNLQESELKGDSLLKILYSPTPEALSLVEREVDFMSQLNHPNIVKFFGSETYPKVEHGINMGFETLIWMEYCQEGNLVDLMNSRISTKFAEAEILYMFCDICQGVGFMHLSSPQIVHRDLKVENVLISKERKFKLCDFGSCTTRIVPPRTQLTMQQIHSLEEDIQKNTTLQYRAPEMIDLFLRKGLTEKTDIWALGVLLYKLCYFTTPFEENGQLAILNCRYDFPQSPQYSDGIKSLISSMLQEDPEERPNIVNVCERVCQLRKVPCPLSGFENVLKEHESSQNLTVPSESKHKKSGSVTEDVFNITQQKGPEMNINTEAITPMRRGRPKKNASVQLVNSFNPNQPHSSSLKDLSSEFSNSDPFAALAQESGQKSSASSVSNNDIGWGSNQTTSSSQEFDPFSLLAQGQASQGNQSTPPKSSSNSDLLGTTKAISTPRRLPRPPSIEHMNTQSNTHINPPQLSQSKLSNNPPPERPPRKISNDDKIDPTYRSFGGQLPVSPSGEFSKSPGSQEDLLLGSTQRRLPRRPSGDTKKTFPNAFTEPPPKPAQRTLARAPSGEFGVSSGRQSVSTQQSAERTLPRPPSNESLTSFSNRPSSSNSHHSRPKASRFDSFEHDEEEEDSLLSTNGYSNLNDEQPFANFDDSDPYDMSQLNQALPSKPRSTSSIPMGISTSLPPPIPPKPPALSILNNLSNSPLTSNQSNKPPPIPPKPRNLQ